MAKKFSKWVLFSALAGATAAGAYYLLQNKTNKSDLNADDLEDECDIDEDLDKEDFSSDASNSTAYRNHAPYISIDIENAKEKIGEKVIETLDKTKEKIEQFNVSEKIDKAKEIVSEMTSSVSEPVYTQMDMSAPSDSPESSESATCAASEKAESSTESFFDDTDKESTEL